MSSLTPSMSMLYRRHTPYFGQPDYRVYEINKRLQQRTEVCHESSPHCFSNSSLQLFVNQESDNLWWDAFATEFFEDDATLTLTFCLEDGPKRYSNCHRQRILQTLLLIMYNLFGLISDRSDSDSPLFPEHLRGRSNGTVIQPEAPERVISQHVDHIGLRPVHSCHTSRQTVQ